MYLASFRKGGETMSLEAVQKVTEAEAFAKEQKTQAHEAASKLIAQAQQAGQAHLTQARAKAEAENAETMAQTEAEAKIHSQAVLVETQRSCDTLRQQAEGRMEDAAALIIRRVVGL